MTKKQVLKHLFEKLDELQKSIESIVDINNPDANLNFNIVRLQSYLDTVKLLKECKDVINRQIELQPDKPDEPFDQKKYIRTVQDLYIVKNNTKLKDTALGINNLLKAINQDKVNLSAGEEELSVKFNDVLKNEFWTTLNNEARDFDEINYKDANAVLGREPDLLTDNLSPLPIDPAKVSEFKPELNMENKKAFDESFRQFLWLAMTDSKVSLFINNHPDMDDDEKQRILNDWQQRSAKKALNDAVTWIANHADPQVREEYVKRLTAIAENTVRENKENEFDDLDKNAIKVASVKNMISSLSQTSAFSKLYVPKDLNRMYENANNMISNPESVDDYNDKYQELAYSDPEYSTYIGAAERCKLVEIYERLVNLEEEGSSAYFKDMVQSVRKVLTTPYSSFEPGNEQLTKDLGMCELTCHKYLDTHKALPVTQEGRDRVALAKSLRDLSQSFCQKSWEKIYQQVALKENGLMKGLDDEAYDSVKKYWMTEKEFDSLMTSSKLCSTVQPMRFRPSMHKEVPTFSFSAKFHAIISKITSIIPIILTPSSWFTSRSAKKAMEMTAEEVKNKVKAALPAAASPQNVDKETVGEDGIILDKRRIPLIWSKEIPEDPNQEIELTINVKQAVDGEDYALGGSVNGSNDPNSRGEKVWDSGHGFFTLKYTSTDPATGQKRRYQTTFGFGGGEYNDAASMVNWYLTDSMIQGSIHNDKDERASIGQSFKITPEQFNKLINFTEGYPKGGYNLMKRNCCTFLADACKEIGLKEAEKFFVEGDAHLPAGLQFALAGATLVTPILSIPIAQPVTQLVTTSRAAKFVGTPSYDYQKFGESLVTPNDIKMMQSYKGIATFHGYSPGAIGERMRSNYGQNFHSSRWLPKKTREMERMLTGELKSQGPALKLAIKNRMTPIISKMKKSERDAENTRLESIFNAIDQNYEKLGKAIEAGIRYMNNKARYPEEIRNVALQVTNAAKLYRENILSIYHNGLKSDDKLNIDFARYISTIELCDRFNQHFFKQSMKKAAESINMIHEKLDKFVDTKREAVGSLASMVSAGEKQHVGQMIQELNPRTNENETNFIGSDGTPLGLLSIYDVCETMEEYLSAPKEKKYLVDEFRGVNVLKADKKTPFTEREIRMMFNQIPKDEKRYSQSFNFNFPRMIASDALKGFLFEKHFSGFGPQIRKEADKFVALDAVISIYDNKDHPAVSLEKQRLKSVYANMIEKGFDFINKKLANDEKARHDFEIMVDATMDYHGYPKAAAENVTEDIVTYNREKAVKLVKLDIVRNLFAPQFLYQTSTTLNNYKMVKSINTLRENGEKLMTQEKLSKLPVDFHKVFEEVHKTATQMVDLDLKLTKENICPEYIEPNYDQRIAALKTKAKENREKEAEAQNAKVENAQVENKIN